MVSLAHHKVILILQPYGMKIVDKKSSTSVASRKPGPRTSTAAVKKVETNLTCALMFSTSNCYPVTCFSDEEDDRPHRTYANLASLSAEHHHVKASPAARHVT